MPFVPADRELDRHFARFTHGLRIHLFSNDVIPASSSDLADFTEPRDGGYRGQLCEGWKVTGGTATANRVGWALKTVGLKVYGCYFTRDGGGSGGDGEYVGAVRFDEVREIRVPGSEIRVTPTLRRA